MTKQKEKINLENTDFETALLKLETIVEKLGSEKVNLEEMVDLYQEGVLLKDHCSKKISDAKMKVDVILKDGQS
jgi:exodeoxyribonuclease VII small subunit